MKILSLRLNNLASLADEQVINFEDEPLAHAGLIAITGKTGAGKSTILDAMCLALFDQIPRLKSAEGQLQDASGKSITIKDSSQILRRGTAEGFAEVEFLALDQKRYLARWQVRRARGKINGNLLVDRSVTALEDGRVLTQKKSECTPTVEKLIGLTFEQFTRAVLLAQSEVGAFLKAKDQERADLLEYLTNSNIFRLVSQVAFEKTKEASDQLNNFKQMIGHIELLSEEQVQQLKSDEADNQQQRTTLLLEQKQLEQAQQWFAKQQEFDTKLTTQRQQLQQLEIQRPQIEQDKTWLEQLEQFQQIRASFDQFAQAQQHIQQANQSLEKNQTAFAKTEQDKTRCFEMFNQVEKSVTDRQQQIKLVQPDIEQAQDLDNQRSQFAIAFKEKKTELEQHHSDLKIQQSELFQLEQDQAKIEKSLDQANTILKQTQDIDSFTLEPKASLEKIDAFLHEQQKFQQLTQNIDNFKVADFHVDNFNRENFRQSLNDLTKEIETQHSQFGKLAEFSQIVEQAKQQFQRIEQRNIHVHGTQRFFTQCQDAQQKKSQLTANLTQQQSALKQLKENQISAEKAHIDAENALEKLQQILADQRLLHSEHIENLRAQLQPEQACMVCGSSTHPFVDHSDLLQQALNQVQDQQLVDAKQRKTEKLQQYELCKQKYLQCQHQIDSMQTQLLELEKQLKQLQSQLETDLGKIEFHLDLSTDSDVRQQQFDAQLNTLKQQQHDAEQHTKTVSAQLVNYQHLRHQLEQQQRIADQLNQLEVAEHRILEQLSEAGENTWEMAWKHDSTNSAEQLKVQIQQRVNVKNALQTHQHALQDLQQKQHALHDKVQWLDTQIAKLNHELERITTQGKENRQHFAEIVQKHSAKTYSSANEWLKDLNQDLECLIDQHKLAQKSYQDAELLWQQQQKQRDQIQSALDVYRKQATQAETEKTTWLAQHPHFNEQLIEQCQNSNPNDLVELRQQIQQFENALLLCQNDLEKIAQLQVAHQSSKPTLELAQLDNQQHLLNEKLTALNQQLETLRSQLIHHEQQLKAYAKYQAEVEKKQQEANRWAKISDLIGSRDGAKFQRYAQHHHLDILLEYANQQLQPLAPRYELQSIPDSLGLAIIDHEMNDEIRPVQSLSGGETFLVSLALALAIANMASGNMKLESLFIDEGFGTLDPSSLHIVMDALDRLQSQGRKVILISHIQEMHERIPVKIQVKAKGSGASEIHVVG